MPSITQPSDYKGRFAITKNSLNTDKIQQFIDNVEPTQLNKLFGVELYALYLVGIGEATPNAIWTKLRDPFFFQSECGKIFESKGLKEMLLGFVYFKYYAETFAQASTNGVVVDVPENSVKASDLDANLYARYNDSVKTYRAIQRYICENMDVYPTFKGQEILLNNWF